MLKLYQSFGSLTIVSQRNTTNPKTPKRLCRCNCGRESFYREADLRNGKSQRCASCAKRGERNPLWKGYGELSGWYWGRVLAGAKKRNLKVDVNIKDAWEKFQKQNGTCALSGVELVMGTPGSSNATASLDRIDSAQGYIPNNIQWVHKTVNLMKLNLSQPEFITWCKLIGRN